MRSSIISFSLVAAILLVFLCTLSLFWTPTSYKDITATVINTPALAAYQAPEPALITEATTTAKVSTPTEITTAPLEDIIPTTKPSVKTAVPAHKAPTQALPEATDLASIVHSLTNSSRSQNDRAELSLDAKLSNLAKERSEEMIDQHYFSHTSPNGCDLRCRFTSASYETFVWGENLAESTSYQMLSSRELAEMFMESWLKSSGHRENLLSGKFTHEGIGVAAKGSRVVVTVIFAKR